MSRIYFFSQSLKESHLLQYKIHIFKALPIMITFPFQCVRMFLILKSQAPPMTKETMEDTVAQMKSFEGGILCSSRLSLSRRNRPALPPEEDATSHTNRPAYSVSRLSYVAFVRGGRMDDCIFAYICRCKGQGGTPTQSQKRGASQPIN